jgi:hypothetical protein
MVTASRYLSRLDQWRDGMQFSSCGLIRNIIRCLLVDILRLDGQLTFRELNCGSPAWGVGCSSNTGGLQMHVGNLRLY